MAGLVDALWVGPYGHRLPDGTLLETGVTVVAVGKDEAESSDHWEVKGKAGKDTPLAIPIHVPEPEDEPEPEAKAKSEPAQSVAGDKGADS